MTPTKNQARCQAWTAEKVTLGKKYKRHFLWLPLNNLTPIWPICTLKYSCDVCQKEFTLLDTLRNHISIQHNEGTTATTCSSKCPHCDKEVQWARKLQMYIDQRHKCPKCEYVTQRTPDLRNIAEKWQKTKTKPESNWRHARKHFPWTEGDQIMQQFVLCDNFIMTNNCHPTNTKNDLETNTILAKCINAKTKISHATRSCDSLICDNFIMTNSCHLSLLNIVMI